MDHARLLQHFETLADTPKAVAKLRKLVLDLAVSGRIVPQIAAEGSATALLRQIDERRLAQLGKGGLQKTDLDLAERQPFGIPDSWSWTSLGRIGRVVGGATPDSRTTSFFAEDGIPWLTPADLYQNKEKFVGRGRRGLTQAGLDSCSAQLMPAGTVLFSSRAPIGYVAIAANELCTNQGFKSCVPFMSGLSEFVYYYLRASVERIEEQASGTTFKEISGRDFASVPVPLPPLAEQKRIVARVEELLALCDELEARQTAAREHRTRLVRSAFEHLTAATTPAEFRRHAAFVLKEFPHLTADREAIPGLRQAILSLAVQGRLVPFDSKEEEQTVADHVEFLNGYAFKSEWFKPQGVRLCRNANVGHGVLDWAEAAHVSPVVAEQFRRFALGEGDIVLSLDRPIISTGLKVAKIRAQDLPSLLLQRVAKAVPKHNRLDLDYLLLWLNSPQFINSIDPGRSNGVPHISTREVESLPFVLPPLAEQKRIVAKVEELMRWCDQLEAQLAAAETAGAGLLDATLRQILDVA
jgi:type I restriction enzyme, S subunit